MKERVPLLKLYNASYIIADDMNVYFTKLIKILSDLQTNDCLLLNNMK